jgi:hypothetical protein
MIRILGIVLAVIFALLSLLHVYWAVGGRFARGAAIPTAAAGSGARLLHPSPFGTLLVAAAFFAAVLVVLGRVKILGAVVPVWIFSAGTWAIALLFLLRAIGDFRYVGFFKSVSGTTFARWDTILFSPLCLFVALAAFLISYYEVLTRPTG